VIAQASQAKHVPKADRTVGVCQALSNPAMPSIPGATLSAYNSLTPAGQAKQYFRNVEKRTVEGPSIITVLERPKHGELRDEGTVVMDADTRVLTDTGERNYSYIPEPGYLGEDRTTLLVEIGGFKVKMNYFFKVEPTVDYKIEEVVCPESMWNISLDNSDPNASIYNFQHPAQLINPLASAVGWAEPAKPNILAGQASKPALPAEVNYDATFSICQAVVPVGNSDFPDANQVGPSPAVLYYFMSRGKEFDRSSWKVTVIEGPHKGALVPDAKFPDSSFVYRPNDGYLGADQITFLVEAQGKTFKVIESVHVVNRPPEYGPDQCPDGFGINELPNPGSSAR
jgi:hypothetical protein